MMRDGAEGTPQNVPEALKMLEDSAENDNINGERGLAETYEFGLGVPKDPERAAFWKNRALARQREESRARAQAEINKRTNAAIGFTVFGLLFLGMIAVAGSSSDQTAESHDAKVYNETRRGQEIYREREWFYRGGGIAGPPSGWNVGDPIPER
jgi:TPR repeat protein